MVRPANGSRQQAWRTPPALVGELANRYAAGEFTLDVAATCENSVCGGWLDDAFSEAWTLDPQYPSRCFCNPPYKDITPWVQRAIGQVLDRVTEVVVMLIPARTGSKWFQIAQGSPLVRIEFIRGRIAFINPESGEPVPGNYEDSLVLVVRRPLVAKDYR